MKQHRVFLLGQRHQKEVEHLSIDEGILLGKIYDMIRAKRLSKKLLNSTDYDKVKNG